MKGKAIGIGGIFFKFREPEKMRNWYRDVLGLTPNDYGVLFRFNTTENPAYLQLGTFEQSSDYFGSPDQQAMINFRVDDLVALRERLIREEEQMVNEIERYEYGLFLHIEDPEGNRIELWEPVDHSFSQEVSVDMR